MKIEIWCDIVCPYCGLAVHRLENALVAFEHGAETQVVHRSFQLHPELSRTGVTQRELLVMRVKNPAEVEKNILRPIEEAAELEGLTPFRAIDRTLGPTDHAHELLAYASEKGLHTEAWRKMFREHFGQARNFWTLDDVVGFATELGLDRIEARAVLESRKYRSQVENDQREAQRLGAAGTPFIVIDGTYSLAGSRSTEQLLHGLREAWQNQHQTQ
jgi:predicted DsbA family dithiol-disulfide isomerase